MKRYSISDIETLTGIKAHTLRIWEQRYSFFIPKRTDTNIRYYDEEDLRLLLNIATLNENGFKISKIAKMTNSQIVETVNKLKGDYFDTTAQIKILSNAIIRFDEREMESLLNRCVNKMGLPKVMDDIIFPLMRKIGFMWKVGLISVANEKFAMHLICNRITAAIQAIKKVKSTSGKRYLLFLPEGETHEAGLLYASYLLKLNGHQVLYLGAGAPAEDIANAASLYEPDYILCVLTLVRAPSSKNKMIDKLLSALPRIPVFVVGAEVSDTNLALHSNLTVIDDLKAISNLAEPDSISLAS